MQRWSGSVWCYEPVLQGDLGRAEHQRVCHEHEDASSIERVSGRSSPSLVRVAGGISMEMEPLYTCCAGLDVHKQTVVACLLRTDGRARSARRFRPSTRRQRRWRACAPGCWRRVAPAWRWRRRAVSGNRSTTFWMGTARSWWSTRRTCTPCPAAKPTCATLSGSRRSSNTGCSRPASSPAGRSVNCAI